MTDNQKQRKFLIDCLGVLRIPALIHYSYVVF